MTDEPMRCPTCGQRVSVHSADEGTQSYTPDAEEECQALRKELEAYRQVAFEAVQDDFDHSWEAEDWVYQKAQEIMAARK